MLEITVTGHATGHYEPAALADALYRAADPPAVRDAVRVHDRVRGTVPGRDRTGARVATEYDVTVSTR